MVKKRGESIITKQLNSSLFVLHSYLNKMTLFDVYPLFDINIVKGRGCSVWDDKGQEYLDLYGGHAVISIGHCIRIM